MCTSSDPIYSFQFLSLLDSFQVPTSMDWGRIWIFQQTGGILYHKKMNVGVKKIPNTGTIICPVADNKNGSQEATAEAKTEKRAGRQASEQAELEAKKRAAGLLTPLASVKDMVVAGTREKQCGFLLPLAGSEGRQTVVGRRGEGGSVL